MPDAILEILDKADYLVNIGKDNEAFELLNQLAGRDDFSVTERMRFLSSRGFIFLSMGDNAKAIELGEELYQLGKNESDDLYTFYGLILKSAVQFVGKPDEGTICIEQAEELRKKLDPTLDLNSVDYTLFLMKTYNAFVSGKIEHALKLAKESLHLAEKNGNEINIGKSYQTFSFIYSYSGNFDSAIEYEQKAYESHKKADNRPYMAMSLYRIGLAYFRNGFLNQAVEYAKRSIKINEIFTLDKINVFNLFCNTYLTKGETERAFEYGFQLSELAEKSGTKSQLSEALVLLARTYHQDGNLDKAIEFLNRSLKISEEIDNDFGISYALMFLVMYSSDKGDFEQSNRYLERLQNNIEKFRELFETFAHYAKAYSLKSSNHRSDRIEAESLFKSVIRNGIPEFKIQTLPHLCNLLLSEFKRYEDDEILEELNQYLTKLMKFAEDQHSYRFLAWSYFLQAKLKLIQNDTDEARRLLSQAQQTADWHGIHNFAKDISHVHDNLLDLEGKWKELEKKNAPISERIEFASVDEVMDRIQTSASPNSNEFETEQPTFLSIMSSTGFVIFSNPFSADASFDKQAISNFISTSNRMFSDSLDRAKFGDYTILLQKIGSFSFCYVFKGQSYSAGQKLRNFTESINENKNMLEKLKQSEDSGKSIIINDISDLEELITASFLSDPKKFRLPFKAYKGKDPFLFVSYAHRDKLQVYPIMDYLNRSGFNIWYDEGISVSENWKKSIVDNINLCSAFLVFISPNIIDSMYVRKEISFALDKKKKFYAVYLKDTQLPDELAFEISGIQSMKKYIMTEDEFHEKLKEVLSPPLNAK